MDLDFADETALRGILDSLDLGISIHGADKRLIYLNPAMARTTGGQGLASVASHELNKKHRIRTVGGVELTENDFPIERAYRGEETKETVLEYIGPSGAHRWLLVSCLRIERDGNLRYVLTTICDVTRRKNHEGKLRFMLESAKILSITSDTRQRLIEKAKLTFPSLADWCALDVMRDDGSTERIAVIHRDPAQIAFLEDFNKRFPPDPSAPDSIPALIRAQTPRLIPLVTEELLKAGAQSPEHLEAIRALKLHSILIVPISARGKGLGAITLAYAESGRTYTQDDLEFFQEYAYHVGVVLDSARLFTELERREKAKNLFLASLSHELRNPLAPIKSSLELLKFKELLPDVREEVEVIEHQFDHMARLLNDLLDVSRFTTSKISIAPRPIELRALLERALRSTSTLLQTADIALTSTMPDAPLFVKADETRLEQAISNLLSNAAKFTPSGGSISVSLSKVDDSARIAVRDSGAGIAPEDLPNIFEMYYQSRRAQNVNSGLGIGLLLVREIVSLHGGTIDAASEGVGKGSQFTITLPLTDVPDTPPGGDAPKDAIRGARVLIVDDNEPAASALARLLRKLGADASTAFSAHDTLSRDDLPSFDIFLIDIGMPEIDGYALVKILRERGVAQPIVALTGYGMSDDKKAALDAGFSAHLTKPIGVQDLRDTFSSELS